MAIGMLLMVMGCAQANNGDELGTALFSTYMARTKYKYAP
jgi:hypothetical protein